MDALRRRVARLFPRRHSCRSHRIGVEQEMLTVDLATGHVASVERVRSAVRHAPYADQLSFEPGGQVEVSLPCAATPSELVTDLERTVAGLRRDCEAAGVGLLAWPSDPRPFTLGGQQVTSPRYAAMRAHFDRIGPAGRRMMCRTASTQICLDWWSGTAGREQWAVLNLAGPFLAAAFAVEPALCVGVESRLATWLAVDPSRTAFDDRLMFGDDPIAAYADFAKRATVFVDPRDIDQHLSTLFPPIRPRGRYLEIRFPDVQEPHEVGRLATTLATLAYDRDFRSSTLRTLTPLTHDVPEHWMGAAQGIPATRDQGLELVNAAIAVAPSDLLADGTSWLSPIGGP